MRKLIILLAALTLVAPLMFYGCGDDGDTGPAGAQGPPGPGGGAGTGVVSNEACAVCHGQNADFQIANVHKFDPITGVQDTLGTARIDNISVTFGDPGAGDNVPVTFVFTFQAESADGENITSGVDLTRKTGTGANDNLAFVSFLLAKLSPTLDNTTGANEWSGFVVEPTLSGSSPFRTNRPDNVTGVVFTRTQNTPAVGTDTYSYKFHTSAVRVSDGWEDNVVMRAGIQFSVGGPFNTAAGSVSSENIVNSSVLDLFSEDLKLQNTSDRRPAVNATKDVVSGVGITTSAAPGPEYPTRNNVTTAACNECHDILAIHGGGRREPQFCVLCHNAKLETAANGASTYARSSLLNLGHRIHTSQDNLIFGVDVVTGQNRDFDFDEVAFPQSPTNCLKCHKGTDDKWKTRPTRYACGSCHTNVNFATGAGHEGGALTTDACTGCHPATGAGFGQSVTGAHANKDGAPPTPNNPYLMPGLAVFQYGIDNVTVDNTNAATVTFWVKRGVGLDNGDIGSLSFVNFLDNSADNTAKRPAGFTGSPAFLIAHSGSALNPQDYTNWDEPAAASSYATGQPKSVNLIGLPITATDNTNTKFRAVLTDNNSFPAGAKMRAVALQAYFTQTSVTGIDENNDGVPDNVARHTPAVMRNVFTPNAQGQNVEAVRRVVAKSGYVNGAGTLVDDPAVIASLAPIGCLECHEAFEGHGGNRVNNVQVCVMCHNPQLTTSGRTINPDNTTINSTLVGKLGSDPLKYPEVTQQMPSLIHGLHAGFGNDPAATSTQAAGLRQQNVRVNNFVIVRNRSNGVYLDSAEVTYPGDLTHCTKCHFPANAGAGNTSQSYKADLPTGVLFATEAVTTGNPNETLAQIIAIRQDFQGSDPSGNPTDNVTSPLASRCGYCHDGPAEVGHFLSTGGADVKATRSTAELTPPTLAPDVTP